MNWKKKLLQRLKLYIILDKDTLKNKNIFRIASNIKKSGAAIVQLRDKNSPKVDILKKARRLKSLLKGNKILFIINDYVEIAQLVDADGLHLGQEDLPLEAARRILGKDKIIGISCHNLKQARQAQKGGADYIGVGPIFSTPTKPEYKPIGINLLKDIAKNAKIPVFAIGGINSHNLNEIVSQDIGCGIAVCRDVCLSRNPLASIKALKEILDDTD
ncbi:MAG: thiamine phosphate synthase [Candidatus Omnitrophica bacterium]|nr:thiamine phosphate synthase [Candidatus Omnitrophota bacterium]